MDSTCGYVLLSLEYHGNLYGGWQRQGKQGELSVLPLPSIQQTVEIAAAQVLSTTFITCVQVAGRTDKGVHALDQRCTLRVPASINVESFAQRMNEQLGDKEIAVCSAAWSSNEKFSVIRKQYKYILQKPKAGHSKRPAEGLHPYSRHESRDFDVDLLRNAFQLMVGTHDFQHLAKQKGVQGPAVRTIYETSVLLATVVADLPLFIHTKSRPEWHMEKHEFWIITILGNGFLWHQVRRMVSLALKVAQGTWEIGSVKQVMEGKKVGPTSVPARGLYLDHVWLHGE